MVGCDATTAVLVVVEPVQKADPDAASGGHRPPGGVVPLCRAGTKVLAFAGHNVASLVRLKAGSTEAGA